MASEAFGGSDVWHTSIHSLRLAPRKIGVDWGWSPFFKLSQSNVVYTPRSIVERWRYNLHFLLRGWLNGIHNRLR